MWEGWKCPPCELWQKTILTCCFLTCQPHWMLGFWKLNKTGNICYFTYSTSYMYISPVKYCMYQYLKQSVKAKWVILNDFKDQDPFWLLSFLKEFEKLLRTSTKFLSDNVRNKSIFLPFSFFSHLEASNILSIAMAGKHYSIQYIIWFCAQYAC